MCRYSITCCTFRRIKWFANEAVIEGARSQLLRTMAEKRFAVTAYCFMEDHVHLLLEGQTDDSALRAAVQRWKQASGYAHRRAYTVPLWQTGYYDHILRDDADVLAAAAYIVANPLRAKLVRSILDYPYIGSDTFTLEQLAEAIQMRRCALHGTGR
jgi:putative transposase